ncbi:TIGR02285 family protein [Desulforhopalus singaporensis]|uniref:Uncharacterized protein n=1 Tax=Desulforhopalus singaporensis TaxID=91360 RepID=A0A1H0THL7_9BACT|nr:TIGR02285 family protein [Desulforhopalus singaporensis]SDP53036.1 conserved hypothetical protein [Desulforhopalus singaporensis]
MKPTVLRYLFVTILFAVFFSPQQPFAANPLIWLEADAPPFFIHDGPYQGQGYEDLITDIVTNHLPQYQHIRMKANISRHYQQWKQGEPACSLAMFKTPERMEFAYFSIPSVFTLPAVLIITKDRYESFGGSKTVSLEEILLSGNFVVGRSENRSYGQEFDNVLDKFGTDKNIFSYEGPQLSENLFRMLTAGRIDALPGLPEEAMYLAESLGHRDKIMTLNIVENQDNHNASLSYVACSKNEWGKKAISAINEVLLRQRPTAEYRAAYERWLDPSSIEQYRKLYREILLNTNE